MRAASAATIVLAFAWLMGPGLSQAPAAITAEERKLAGEIQEQLRSLGQLVIRKQYDEAAQLFAQTQTSLSQLAGRDDRAVQRMIAPLKGRLEAARRFLKGRNVDVPAWPAAGAASSPNPSTPPGEGVSFTQHVAPILLGRCRNCHVNRTSGQFSMANFDALARGVGGAAVVEPGNSKQSMLIEVLVKGDMPKGGGGKLPEAQIATIAKWIDEGAKFDGQNRGAPLASLAPQPEKPKLEVTQATGKETVLFSRDIAGVLAENCISCHGGRQPEARLSLENFQSILRGSRENVIIVPGKPAESLLIKKLKGTADGQRMPLRRPPLDDETIAKFEKWIAEGAKFDGPSPTTPTEQVARIYEVSQMTHEELAAERLAMAGKNWQLGNPGTTPDRVETENYLLLGNVGEDRLKEIAQVAQEQQGKIARLLGAPSAEPLFKGRLTMFVFNKRWQYSEFGTMVEKREIPGAWRGHWRYTIVDAYATLYPPQFEGDGSLETLVAEQLAGAYVETLGRVPRWFSQGVGRAVAAQTDPKDPRVISWNDSVKSAASGMSKADDFLQGKLTPENTAVLNYSFAKFLMDRGANFKRLLSAVESGAEFEKAFGQAYGGTPSQVAVAWARSALR